VIARKKGASSVQRFCWRPDFSDRELLPELSTVRARFLLPGIAATVAVVLVGLLLIQEYRASTLSENIVSLREEIASYDEQHSELVEMNAEFIGLSRSIDEVVDFKSDKLVGSDFLLSVSSKLLDGMYLNRVDYLNGRAEVEGSVEVPAEEASILVNEYLESLENADVLQGVLSEYKLTSLERDGKEQRVKFLVQVSDAEKEEEE